MLIHNINEIKKPKNVVILGANGFIGKSLSIKLESEGISVKKLSRKDIDLLDVKKDSNILDLQKSLEEKTGLNVSIANKKDNSGSISFSYQDLDQLDKIINAIKKNY